MLNDYLNITRLKTQIFPTLKDLKLRSFKKVSALLVSEAHVNEFQIHKFEMY